MRSRENSIVFTPAWIGPLRIRNRLVRSATYENSATRGGEVTEALLELYSTLAKGGVGLIITGAASVFAKAPFMHASIHADDDSFIPSLAKIPRVVHEFDSDCRVMLQLNHAGRQVLKRENTSKLMPLIPPALIAYLRKHPEIMADQAEMVHEVELTAPSAVYDATFDHTPRALTHEEIGEIIEAFAEGARRAKEAGFDGVQLHAAHGYLLSSFLSPRTNRRADEYGGSTENRTWIFRPARLRPNVSLVPGGAPSRSVSKAKRFWHKHPAQSVLCMNSVRLQVRRNYCLNIPAQTENGK